MKKTKVAVIGCGNISAQHLRSYTDNPLTEIKYAIDIIPERAEQKAKEYNIPFTEEDFTKILDDEDIEAVSICTPNDTHASIAIACLNAGKHVLCEKPAAMNMKQVEEMKAAAKKNDKILNIGVVNRFNTAVTKIKEMIEDDELGKIYHVYCSFRSHRSIPGLGGPFTTKAEAGGGVLIDWGVHFLDLIFYSLNNPKVKTISGAIHSELAKNMEDYDYINMWAGPPNYEGTYDVEDFVTGMIRTAGPTISLNGAWAQNIGEAAMFVEFIGDKGGIKFDYGGDFKLYTAKKGTLYETIPSYTKADMFYEEVNGFIESALSGKKNRSHIENTAITSEVMEAIYDSAEKGEEVTL